VISVPTKMQTKQGLCLIIKCQWIQFGLRHLDNNRDEVKSLYAFGWQNLKVLNVFHQTCQTSWFVVSLWLHYGNTPQGCQNLINLKMNNGFMKRWLCSFCIFVRTIINSSMDITTSSFDTNMVSKQEILYDQQ